MAVASTKTAKKSPTQVYLESLGVTVDPEALKAPDIDSLIHSSENEWEWLDKTGAPVPPDIELYRVEQVPGEAGKLYVDQVIQAKKAEWYTLLKGDHGFRMRGLHGEGDVV